MVDTPETLGANSVLSLLSALPLPSSAAQDLIAVHAPFGSTSSFPTAPLNKWLVRLSSSVAARDPAACSIAALVVQQDVEGYVTAQHGKSWMAACLGSLGGSLPVDCIPPFLGLIRALVAAGPYAPAFEREVVNPAMGKLAITVGKLVERAVESSDWGVLNVVLEACRELIVACPPPFRPAIPTLRSALMALALSLPPTDSVPESIRVASAETLALLYLCGGKAAAGGAWGSEMKDALGGLAASIAALCADAWEEEAPRTPPFPPPATLPSFSLDPVARATGAVNAIEGYTEVALALLRLTTARPVPVPLAQIVSTGLRLLNLTLDIVTAPHISPAHSAVLVGCFPRLWRCGVLLLASAAVSTGDHMVPHIGPILEHSVYLLERIPPSMTDSRLMLLQFHGILLDAYPAPTLPVEYTSRLLRFSLGVLGTLLDTRPVSTTPQTGRKGKKRARGAEDALVGALEGRSTRGTSAGEADVILAVLGLTPKLHTAPLLSPALLTFSIRLHLSLHLALLSRPTLTAYTQITQSLDVALEAAAHLESGGTARDVRTLLISLLPGAKSLNELLHPALPPMARPLPPLSQLHMFAPESEEEKKVRRELGFGDDAQEEEEDEEMAVDEQAVLPLSVPVITPIPVLQPVMPLPVLPVPAAPVPAVPVPAAPVPIPTLEPVLPAPAPASAVPPTPISALDPAVPFMSVPDTATAPAAAPVAEPAPTLAPALDESDDEAIPDLDSGSSDEEEDDE